MSRRQEVENIIIGTLLESNWRKNYYDDCRCVVSQEMFEDETNRRLYGIISEMNMRGDIETDPSSIFDAYGSEVLDILPAMLELVTEYSFIHKKVEYNEREFRKSAAYGCKPRYTEVTFTDYVNLFLKMVYGNEKRQRKAVI